MVIELIVEVKLDGIQLFHRNDDHYISLLLL